MSGYIFQSDFKVLCKIETKISFFFQDWLQVFAIFLN